MKTTYKTGEKGLIKWLLIIIIAIILASYFFDFSVQDAIENEQTQSNLGYIKENFIYFYDTYLRATIEYLWNDIFIDLIWNTFTENMQAIQDGEPTVFEDAANSQIDILEQSL
ncbi:MAG: hypothetical protein ACJAV6_000590 [Candidatus Paceibacteria bacterium]|jgi:hypothetical protein